MTPKWVPVIAAASSLVLLASCSRTVETGNYGPLEIGASKEATLTTLERLDIRRIEPVVYPAIRVVNPKRKDLDVFAHVTGIRIIAEDHPVPLHVEFGGDLVNSTRPNFGEYPYVPRYPYSGPALLALMQVKMPRGITRADTFDAIASFITAQKIVVEAEVAGFEKMRGTDALPWTGEYRALLLANDEWRFEGLRDEVWYPAQQSNLTLHFRSGKLAEITRHASLF